MLLAMMVESQRNVAGLVHQLRSDYRALGNQSPPQILLGAGVNLPDPQLPPVGYTTAFADSQADRDDAILLATIQSMQQGTYVSPPVLPVAGPQLLLVRVLWMRAHRCWLTSPFIDFEYPQNERGRLLTSRKKEGMHDHHNC